MADKTYSIVNNNFINPEINKDKTLIIFENNLSFETSDFKEFKFDKIILAVNSNEDGMELKNPLNVFSTQERQTINGDGVATQYSLTFTTTQDQAMVFVGGVIQDPSTH